jgi:hypothetical protein
MVEGFPVILSRRDRLQLNTYLPAELKEMRLDIPSHQQWGNLILNHKRLTVSTHRGSAALIKIGFRDEVAELKAGDTIEFDL